MAREAIDALAGTGDQAHAEALVEALRGAEFLRTREAARTALRTLLDKDLGYDADAWAKVVAGKPARKPEPAALPAFFGAPVASDSVLVILDTSRSMNWMERLDAAIGGCREYVAALPDDASFTLFDMSRDVLRFNEGGLVSGATNRESADEWLAERQTRGGARFLVALEEALETLPQVDTICIATDSHPWGKTRSETSQETLEVFRHLNRTRRVRLVIALVMPGGRYEPSERTELEIERAHRRADRPGRGVGRHVDPRRGVARGGPACAALQHGCVERSAAPRSAPRI